MNKEENDDFESISVNGKVTINIYPIRVDCWCPSIKSAVFNSASAHRLSHMLPSHRKPSLHCRCKNLNSLLWIHEWETKTTDRKTVNTLQYSFALWISNIWHTTSIAAVIVLTHICRWIVQKFHCLVYSIRVVFFVLFSWKIVLVWFRWYCIGNHHANKIVDATYVARQQCKYSEFPHTFWNFLIIIQTTKRIIEHRKEWCVKTFYINEIVCKWNNWKLVNTINHNKSGRREDHILN